jgi:hypothetical protein
MHCIAPLLLASCAGAPAKLPSRGDVGLREVDAAVAPSARLTLAPNENFQRPLFDSENALPRYPETLLARRLPAQPVCLQVGISERGRVMLAEPVAAGAECAATPAAAPEFVAAARAAALRWRFDPAFRCVYPPGATPEPGYCDGEGVEEIPQAVSLTYRFVFEQRDGRGRVRMAD